jgi:hypothetical protein
MLLDLLARHRCREEDPAHGTTVVQVCRHDELGTGQRDATAPAPHPPIPQQEARGATASLRDAIGVGQRQQDPAPLLSDDAFAHTELAPQCPRMRADPLHRIPRDARSTDERRRVPPGQQVQPDADVGIGGTALAAQDVALLHEGREVGASDASASPRAPEDHVAETGMQAKAAELLAVRRDPPAVVDGAEVTKQLPRLCQVRGPAGASSHCIDAASCRLMPMSAPAAPGRRPGSPDHDRAPVPTAPARSTVDRPRRGACLPARPARWVAPALDTRTVSPVASSRCAPRKRGHRDRPASTTTRTPSIVRLVSAMRWPGSPCGGRRHPALRARSLLLRREVAMQRQDHALAVLEQVL